MHLLEKALLKTAKNSPEVVGMAGGSDSCSVHLGSCVQIPWYMSTVINPRPTPVDNTCAAPCVAMPCRGFYRYLEHLWGLSIFMALPG